MKVSLKWLSDYIDIDIPVQTLANIMTGFGLEIEGIYNIEADTIFDIDIPPQRPDLLGVIGIARELGIFLNKELHIPQFSLKEGEEPIENKINVKILDNELCKRYSIGMIRGIEPGESPNWLKERIEPCGIGARNSVVDTTNYVMFELGHPVHAFDYDKLKMAKKLLLSMEFQENYPEIYSLYVTAKSPLPLLA
jgi:phenylalanyl-tRNA synthetase beta chain